jgi:uncharacterized protein
VAFLLFFLFWVSLVGIAYWYVGRRIIKAAKLQRGRAKIAWAVVAGLFLVPQVPFFLFLNKVQNLWVDALSWVGYVVLGFFSLTFTFVILRDVAMLARRGWDKIRCLLARKQQSRTNSTIDNERRRFLVHSTNVGIIALATVAGGYGLSESRRRATIEQIHVPIKHLPPEFDGFRIVQFTDLHVGPTIKRKFVERVVEQVLELKADLIVFTGDLVDGSVSWLQDEVAPLRELFAPYGKMFVTGNHEYYSGADAWVKEAGRLGFDVLLNEHRIMQRGNGRIVLAGVTDFSGGDFIRSHRSDPAVALANAPEAFVRILLAHQPRSVFLSEKSGVDLQVSGHTHGGQFFPWNHLATLNQPYVKGLHKHSKTWIYVSRGTGYWGPPLRLGVPPEITVIRLTKA